MNRFQMLRVFVLMTLRGREVPLQDLVVEYGMEEELLAEIVHLNERESRRDREWNTCFMKWEHQLDMEHIGHMDSLWRGEDEEPYVPHPSVVEAATKMDRAKRRVNRLFVAMKKLQDILNPADKWEGIPF